MSNDPKYHKWLDEQKKEHDPDKLATSFILIQAAGTFALIILLILIAIYFGVR